jgi:hypothetical protein
MSNKWNKLKSSWGASSEKGSIGISRDGTTNPVQRSRDPSTIATLSTTNLAPHSAEDEDPNPLDEIPAKTFSSKEQQQTASWKFKSQSIISPFQNRSSGSVSSKTAPTIVEKESSAYHLGSSSTLDSAEIPPIHYKDLLSLPPKQISFVIVKNKHIDHTYNNRVCDTEKNKSLECDCGDDLNSSQKGLSKSSGLYDIGAILGVHLIKNSKTKQFEVSEQSASSLQERRPLLSPRETILLVQGDKLQSINGFRCQRCQDADQLCQRLIQEHSRDEVITLTFVCSPSETSEQSFYRQDLNTPMIHQVTLVTNEDVELQQVTGDCEELTRSNNQTFLKSERLAFNSVTKEDPTDNSQILRLASIPLNNWLEHSCARCNDVVLAVNTIPCYELYPQEADIVLQTMVKTHSCVNIKLYTPPLTRRESIKRAAIATAGGVLVGTGAVIMATPLHPIGHAMALGGLGVLGTEFEGPKRALARVTDAARRFRSSNNKQGQSIRPSQLDGKEQEES